MSVTGKFLTTAMLSLVFTASANAQAPQAEKNVSMKMALMIIEGALEQCTKDTYKVSVVIVDKGGNVAASVRGVGPIHILWNSPVSRPIPHAPAARLRSSLKI